MRVLDLNKENEISDIEVISRLNNGEYDIITLMAMNNDIYVRFYLEIEDEEDEEDEDTISEVVEGWLEFTDALKDITDEEKGNKCMRLANNIKYGVGHSVVGIPVDELEDIIISA